VSRCNCAGEARRNVQEVFMSQLLATNQAGRIGRFTLIERLAVGGQSEVWRVIDATADVHLALKILSSVAANSPNAWRGLEREYTVSALLRHPGILRVLPPERLDGYVVLPMELADGGTLAKLRGDRHLHIVPVLLELASALQYAHGRGVIHRDLKPQNVLFDSDRRVKLADFGVAALLPGCAAEQDLARAWGGSPFTASPAQLRGAPPSPADDIYGLGALAYELLSGRPPYYPIFDAQQIQRGPVPPLVPTRETPAQLIELVMRMLATRVEERPSSMHQVGEELELSLNATLALDLTELADLSAGGAERPRPDAQSQTSRSATGVDPSRRDAARGPISAPQAPPEGLAVAPQPVPAPLDPAAEPPVLESINPFADQVPSVHTLSLTGPGDRLARGAEHRTRPHRIRYAVLGLLVGLSGVLWVLQARPGALTDNGVLRSLAAIVARIRTEHAVGVPAAAASDTAARSAALPRPARAAAPQPRIESRSSARVAHAAPGWNLAGVAVVKTPVSTAKLAATGRIGAQTPQVAEGRRAERAGHHARAVYEFSQVTARRPASASAQAALAQARAQFRAVNYQQAIRAGLAAIARNRLYHAQADFEQALVFRPAGIAAATELGEVNAILSKRTTLAQRMNLRQRK